MIILGAAFCVGGTIGTYGLVHAMATNKLREPDTVGDLVYVMIMSWLLYGSLTAVLVFGLVNFIRGT